MATANEGRQGAVLALFEGYFDRVYRFVRRSVDASTAEEIAQDVFLKLLTQENLETKTISVSYLIKIADNMLKRRYRKTERARAYVGELARASREECTRPGAMTALDNNLPDGSLVGAAFDRLGNEEREAVRLIVCEGLSYEHAARSMGVRVSTINNWKHRGLQRMREDATESDGRGGRERADGGRGVGREGPGSGGLAYRGACA